VEKANLKTENLKKEVIKIFKNHGLSNPHAVISANALINAELVGAYGHGLSRLRMYCERISKKVINPKKSGLYQFHSYGQPKGESFSSYLGSWTIVID